MKAILFATALILSAHTAQADKKIAMKQGLWVMTGEIEMAGQKMQAPRIEHCVTARDLDGSWFQQLPQAGTCEGDQTVTAKTVKWSLSCKPEGGGTIKSTGRVRYTATTFEGSATISMTIPNAGTHRQKATMSGRYIGRCKKGARRR